MAKQLIFASVQLPSTLSNGYFIFKLLQYCVPLFERLLWPRSLDTPTTTSKWSFAVSFLSLLLQMHLREICCCLYHLSLAEKAAKESSAIFFSLSTLLKRAILYQVNLSTNLTRTNSDFIQHPCHAFLLSL